MNIKIAFIGLGNMGAPMAGRLVDAGFDVTVHSRTAASVVDLVATGAVAVADVASAVQGADFVLTCLPTPQVVQEIYLRDGGIVQSVRPGTTLVDFSTVGPHLAVRIAEASKVRGVEFLDAPVSGGVQRAVLGTLSIMVGGEVEVLNSAEPVLRSLGQEIRHVGPAGSGQLVKLCNNMVVAITQVALGEVMVAGRQAGLSTETLFGVLSTSSADSFVLSSYFPLAVFPEPRPTLFSLDLMAKDIGLFLDFMGPGRVPLTLSELARDIFKICQDRGLGSQDSASVVEFYEEFSDEHL